MTAYDEFAAEELAEIVNLIETTQWVPFTAELQKQYNAFDVTEENPLFANNDGLLMVKNGSVVSYISENGHIYGLYDIDRDVFF